MDTLERIYSELKSREFHFIVGGRKYSLPHLNTMKRELEYIRKCTKSRRMTETDAIFYLFEQSGSTAWIDKYKTIRMREIRQIFKSWQEWSGFSLGK